MPVTDTQVEALIIQLEKIADGMEAAAAADAGGGPEPGAPTPSRRESPANVERRIKSLKEEIALLGDKEDAIGRLTQAEDIAREILENKLELQEKIKAVEDGSLTAEEKSKEIAKLKRETEGLNKVLKQQAKELEAGSAKADKLVGSFTNIGDEAEQLLKFIPKTADEFTGMADSLMEGVMSGKLFYKMAAKVAAESFNLAVQTDQAQASFRLMTGAADTAAFGHYAQVISDTRDQTAIFGATMKELSGHAGALYDGYSDFTTLTEDQKQAILGQTAALDKLNVSSGTSAKIFDTATKSLGYNKNELVGLTQRLHNTAQSLGKSTASVFADFADVANQLAFYGKDVEDVFQRLEKQSKATGLSTSQLVAISGTAFDTFEGAAEKVGKLNAILGGPYLNSIDMLNADEATRIELLKQSMDLAGQTFTDLGKYEQLTIADALGMKPDEARRIFGNLSAAQEMQIREQEKIADTAREAQTILMKLKNAFMSLIVAMDIIIQPIAWVVEGISWLIGLLGRLPEVMQKAIKGTFTAVMTFFALSGGVKAVGKALQGFARKLARLAGPGSALGKFAAGLFKVGTRLKLWPMFLRGLFRTMSTGIKSIAAWIPGPGWALYIIIAVIEAVIFGFKDLLKAFKGTFGLIAGLITGDGQKIKKSLGMIFDGLSKFVYHFVNALTFGLLGLFLGLFENAEKIKKWIGAIFLAIGVIVSPFFSGIAITIGVLVAAWYILKGVILAVKNVWDLFVVGWQYGWGAVKEAMAPVMAKLGESWRVIKLALLPLQEALGQLKESFAELWKSIGPLMTKYVLPVLKGIGKIIGGMMLAPMIAAFFIFIGLLKGFAMTVEFFLTPILAVIEYLTNTVIVIIGLFTTLVDIISQGVSGIADFLDFLPFGGTIEATAPTKVDDVIITSSGQVIEPSSQDIILAAKPGGPIANAGALFPFGSTTPGAAGGEGAGAPPVIKFDKRSIVVKVGETELQDIVVQMMKAPEFANLVSGFGE